MYKRNNTLDTTIAKSSVIGTSDLGHHMPISYKIQADLTK